MKDIKAKDKKQMKFRVTDKEYEKIQKKIEKSNLKQNEYLLRCALDKKITIVEGLPEIILEVKRVGVNLNQLTKSANQGRLVGKDTIEDMEKELKEVWQLLRQLIREQA